MFHVIAGVTPFDGCCDTSAARMPSTKQPPQLIGRIEGALCAIAGVFNDTRQGSRALAIDPNDIAAKLSHGITVRQYAE
ncbi:MAG TPA: hypothetical protein VK466_05220 [Terriglobales bacterium]|nr:hypothetical protein [Terriglobales bacterium]